MPDEQVSITASLVDKSLSSGLGKIKGLFNGIKSDVNKLSSAVAPLTGKFAALIATVAGLQRVREDIDAAREAVQGERLLLAALDDNVKALEALKKVAQDIQKNTIFSDDEAIATATRLRSLGVPVRDLVDALKLTLDVSARLGKDTEATATVIAKAYRGDVEALKRFGIVIDESGNAVDQLKKRFGGTAAAIARTDFGRIDQLENKLNDLAEDRGKIFARIKSAFLTGLVPAAEKFNEEFVRTGKEGAPLLERIAQTLGGMVPTLIKIGLGIAAAKFVLWVAPVLLIATKLAVIGGAVTFLVLKTLEWTGAIDSTKAALDKAKASLASLLDDIVSGRIGLAELGILFEATFQKIWILFKTSVLNPIIEGFKAAGTVLQSTLELSILGLKTAFTSLRDFALDKFFEISDAASNGFDSLGAGILSTLGIVDDDLIQIQKKIDKDRRKAIFDSMHKGLEEERAKSKAETEKAIEENVNSIANAIPNAIAEVRKKDIEGHDEIVKIEKNATDEVAKLMIQRNDARARATKQGNEDIKKQTDQAVAEMNKSAQEAENVLSNVALTQGDIQILVASAVDDANSLIDKGKEAQQELRDELERTKNLVEGGNIFSSEGFKRNEAATAKFQQRIAELNAQFDKLIEKNPEAREQLEQLRQKLIGLNEEFTTDKSNNVTDFFSGLEAGLTGATEKLLTFQQAGIDAGKSIREDLAGSIKEFIATGNFDLQALLAKISSDVLSKFADAAIEQGLSTAFNGLDTLFAGTANQGPPSPTAIPGQTPEPGIFSKVGQFLGLTGGGASQASVVNIQAQVVNIAGAIGGGGVAGVPPSGLNFPFPSSAPSSVPPIPGANQPQNAGGGFNLFSPLTTLLGGTGPGGLSGLLGQGPSGAFSLLSGLLTGGAGSVLGGLGGLLGGAGGGALSGFLGGQGAVDSVLGGLSGLFTGGAGGLLGGLQSGFGIGTQQGLAGLLNAFAGPGIGAFLGGAGAVPGASALAGASSVGANASLGALFSGLFGLGGTTAATGATTAAIGAGTGAAVGAGLAPWTFGLSLLAIPLLSSLFGGLFDEGGLVPGPATGDNRFVGVGGNEFILNSGVVNSSSLPFLNALNAGLIPPAMLAGIGHSGHTVFANSFDEGGSVSRVAGKRWPGFQRVAIVSDEESLDRQLRGGRRSFLQSIKNNKEQIKGILS